METEQEKLNRFSREMVEDLKKYFIEEGKEPPVKDIEEYVNAIATHTFNFSTKHGLEL